MDNITTFSEWEALSLRIRFCPRCKMLTLGQSFLVSLPTTLRTMVSILLCSRTQRRKSLDMSRMAMPLWQRLELAGAPSTLGEEQVVRRLRQLRLLHRDQNLPRRVPRQKLGRGKRRSHPSLAKLRRHLTPRRVPHQAIPHGFLSLSSLRVRQLPLWERLVLPTITEKRSRPAGLGQRVTFLLYENWYKRRLWSPECLKYSKRSRKASGSIVFTPYCRQQ
jgi:hypothetical protein